MALAEGGKSGLSLPLFVSKKLTVHFPLGVCDRTSLLHGSQRQQSCHARGLTTLLTRTQS